MEKKKLVIYVDTMNLSGGRERVIANLIHNWVKEYEITLLAKDGGDSYYPLPKDVKIVSLDISMKLNLKSRISRILTIAKNLLSSVVKLRKILKTLDYDYIYVSTPLNAFEAYYAMKEPEKQLVISEHASKDAFNSLYTWMKHHIYPKSYCISVPNKMDTEEYIKEGCNAVYIPHTLTFSAEQQNTLNSKIMLNVGRLTSDKQQELLIRTWSRIQDYKGWKLWIVGEGEEESKLKKTILECNAKDSISLLPARKNIKDIYKQASCFILTSRSEGFGMVLLEAMAFGVPCISFDCPSGPRDIILNNKNGIMVPNNNIVALLASIEKIINYSEEELMILGEGAFSTVNNWNNEEILKEWSVKIYK